MSGYLDDLNEPQKQAVLHKEGPLMIIAGAGSGKTKVLTTRITHLMAAHKVDSFNILALTFTNKAAAEMKERVEKVLAQFGQCSKGWHNVLGAPLFGKPRDGRKTIDSFLKRNKDLLITLVVIEVNNNVRNLRD